MCLKIAYPDQHTAHDAAVWQAYRFQTLPMLTYRCPDCQKWHLTCNGDPARKLPERPPTVRPQPLPLPEPEESPYREYAHLWYATHGKELKRIARFGRKLRKY